MHGNTKVIEQLNAALVSELTAIVQYMVQSETCHNWGYMRLGDYLKRRAIAEMHHAEGIIERIVFLDATPRVDVALAPKIGANVQQQLENDLKDEEDTVRQYNSAKGQTWCEVQQFRIDLAALNLGAQLPPSVLAPLLRLVLRLRHPWPA